MADDYKSGVTRVLETAERQYSNVVWQAGKPPLDSELNMMGQVSWEALSSQIRANTHSGWLTDPLRADEDFIFHEKSANYFELAGRPTYALVNGWVVPVAGSNSSSGLENAISLPPPPATNSSTTFVFLEVWRAVLEGDNSDNRPTNSSVYKYGNVDYSAGNPVDDELVDPTLGFSTTKRVQVQYRIRVQQTTTDITTYPEGLGSPDVYAQGTLVAPNAGYTFTNMKDEGDTGLWRAGAGDEASQTDLGTVDGYVYAIPICAVFRRNSNRYSAISNGTPNHNGSISRLPSGGSGILTDATLTADLAYNTTGAISITGLIGSGLDDVAFFGQALAGSAERFLVIGSGINREVFSISAVDSGAGTITIQSRGRAGTDPKNHSAGASVEIYTGRLDGKFADQITREDVLDLRHSISMGGFDYQSLLQANLNALLGNSLKTTFKQAGVGSSSYGVEVVEVSSIFNPNGATRQHSNFVDAPDGIRTIWSDTAVVHPDVTFLCDMATATDSNGFTTQPLDTETTDTWTIGASFNPQAFIQTGGLRNGTAIFFNIGGANGSSGARAGIRSDLPDDVVRLISPREMQDKDFKPVKVRYMGFNRPNGEGESGTQGLYTAPTESSNFETPFIVLGDSLLSASGRSANKETGEFRNLRYLTSNGVTYESVWAVDMGVNLDSLLDTPSLHGTTTLRNLITKNGDDLTGYSSEAYLVIHGDTDAGATFTNNGVFKIISVGADSDYLPILEMAEAHSGGVLWQVGDSWSTHIANSNRWAYLLRVGSTANLFGDNPSASLTFDVRTQYLDSRDSSCAIVFTAIEDVDSLDTMPIVANRSTSDNVLISVSLLYPPGHGATARVLDKAHAINLRSPINDYLRNNTSDLDSTGVTTIPLPAEEILFPTGNQIGLWSGLDSFGSYASESVSYGDTLVAGQISKEAEAFVDLGSKTLMLRPYRLQYLKGFGHTLGVTSIGSSNYANGTSKLGASGIFQATSNVWEVPHETMPSFGRQDIPYHRKTGANDQYMEGFNHLFLDERDTTNGVFKIIGGESNGASGGVRPILFVTGGQYGARDNTSNSAINAPYYGADLISLSGKPTSEFGEVLNGVRLPPHFGIARLFGVYEKADFEARAVDTGGTGFESDRETEHSNGPTNLLRKDTSLYPIHILENGAIVETGEVGSHTYVVTEHAIDITKIPSYVAGQSFSDFNYVVECTVFGFALGFISQNNFVFSRQYTGTGATIPFAPPAPIEALPMVVPSPVPQSEEVYVAGMRTPYQGDPFHTVGGSSPEVSDSVFRYGQIDPALAFNFSSPRGQLEADGSSAIEVTNPRTVEVLATLDFYTTQGTGAIATYREGTLDLGFAPYQHTDQELPIESRIPALITEELPQTNVGLFSQALDSRSTNAQASLWLDLNSDAIFKGNSGNHHLVITYTRGSFTAVLNGEDYAADLLTPLALIAPSHFRERGVGCQSFLSTLGTVLVFDSDVRGEDGNRATLSVSLEPKTGAPNGTKNNPLLRGLTRLSEGVNLSLNQSTPNTPTKVRFAGGRDVPVNAGNGSVNPSEVGTTSRLPLGILLSDFDFSCEEPLRNNAGSLTMFAGSSTPLETAVPTDAEGNVYTRISGAAGELLQMGDGTVLDYTAYPTSANRRFRVLRGGGAVYGASGAVPGAPLTFLNESFPAEINPVLKGAVLAGRAMLVRNFYEQAFSVQDLADRSYGDELMLLVVTQGCARNADGSLVVGGAISPSGYGEGFAAADRFRIKGRPLIKGESPDVALVVPAKK